MRERLMATFLVLILVAFGFAVYQKEQLKANGKTLLLELAPVDPRSLIQGDYMRLRFKLSNALRSKDIDRKTTKFIIVKPNAKNVAQFVRVDDGQPIGDGEQRLRVHRKSNRLEIVPNSFLFQEGHAKHYDDAKYGVFKVDTSGKNLLVDLADKDQKVIDPKLTKEEKK